MSNRAAKISYGSFNPQYGQGASNRGGLGAGRFLAPTVEVDTHYGTYPEFSEKNRFFIPNTRRGVGGLATEIILDATERNFNADPHALDCPVDLAAGEEPSKVALNDGLNFATEVADLQQEQLAITRALAAAGAGTAMDISPNAQPITAINYYILALMKVAKYPNIAVLFGANAAHVFMNHPNVAPKLNGDFSYEAHPGLFHNKAPFMAAYALVDAAGPGAAENVDFTLSWDILIFTRSPNPTRRDPSFMKTFRVTNERQGATITQRSDGRVSTAQFDWSEDVRVTNTAGVTRLVVPH